MTIIPFWLGKTTGTFFKQELICSPSYILNEKTYYICLLATWKWCLKTLWCLNSIMVTLFTFKTFLIFFSHNTWFFKVWNFDLFTKTLVLESLFNEMLTSTFSSVNINKQNVLVTARQFQLKSIYFICLLYSCPWFFILGVWFVNATIVIIKVINNVIFF